MSAPSLDDFLAMQRDVKETMGWGDLQPIAHVFYEGGQNAIVLLAGFPSGSVLHQGVSAALSAAAEGQPPITAVLFFADARMRMVSKGDRLGQQRLRRLRPGALQGEWEAGQREGIVECLLAMRVEPGRAEVIVQSYDAERRRWDEPEPRSDIAESGILDAITDALGWSA